MVALEISNDRIASGPGEVAPWLRALTDRLEDLCSLVPSTHIGAHSHLELQIPTSSTLLWLLWVLNASDAETSMQVHPYTEIKINKILKKTKKKMVSVLFVPSQNSQLHVRMGVSCPTVSSLGNHECSKKLNEATSRLPVRNGGSLFNSPRKGNLTSNHTSVLEVGPPSMEPTAHSLGLNVTSTYARLQPETLQTPDPEAVRSQALLFEVTTF